MVWYQKLKIKGNLNPKLNLNEICKQNCIALNNLKINDHWGIMPFMAVAEKDFTCIYNSCMKIVKWKVNLNL